MSFNHLQPEIIESYINGTLDEIENERVIQHLGECEICLEEVEQLWKRIEGVGSIENERIKERLLQKVYHTNYIGHFIRLSIKGFLITLTGLLYPIWHKKQVISQNKESKHE